MSGAGSRPCITLLTDFGLDDPYVGVMKGVIHARAPEALVVDLCHGIPPQDVTAAAFHLASSFRYFRPGTIHVVVVDPGVGSSRRLVGIRTLDHVFVGPDNGVFGALPPDPAAHRVEILERRFFLSTISPTFHGRDILAPVAAALAGGEPLGSLGPTRPGSTACPWPEPVARGGQRHGEVLWIDRFGNALTNVFLGDQPATGEARLEDGRRIAAHGHYAAVAVGEPLALKSSSGYLELAVRDGSARDELRLARGTPVAWRSRADANSKDTANSPDASRPEIPGSEGRPESPAGSD